MKYFFTYFLILFLSIHKCWSITFDELKNLVVAEIQKKVKYQNIKIKISTHSNLTNKNNIIFNNVTISEKDKFIADISLDNKQYQLHGVFYKYLKVPVTKNLISQGKIIDENDIIMNDVNTTSLKSNIIIDKDQLIGMVAKRNISQNGTFKSNDIKQLTVIAKGDLVTLLFLRNHLEIKTTGTALNSGGIGNIIKVKVHDTNKIVIGKVINSSLVELRKND